MVVGAEKSHSLPSASWKTRKAGGIIDLQSKDLNCPGGAKNLLTNAGDAGVAV